MHRRHLLTGTLLALTLACSPSEPDEGRAPKDAGPPARPAPAEAAAKAPAAEPVAPSREELVKRGRSVYLSNCTACHNMDPSQDGSLGPAIAGSSRELIEARVLHNTYPEGYTPKRDTKLMVALPHLRDDIDALAAYLSE